MKRWQVWIGFAISVIFLFLAFRGMDFKAIAIALKSADIFWIVPGIPVYFIGLWLRAVRWKLMLDPAARIETRKIFSIITIGYMGNNIYPARLGELVRAALLKREEKLAIATSFTTIILERVFDGIIMVGFVFLNIANISSRIGNDNIKQTIDSVALWASVVFIISFLFFLAIALFPKQFSRIFNQIILIILPRKIARHGNQVVDRFFSGLRSLSSAFTIFKVLFLTIIIWLLETIFYWIIMQAFSFNVNFGMLMFLNGFLNLFTIIPSSPGYIGTFDAPGIALLTALGISKNIAAGYTLLLHAALWLPVTLVGAYLFAQKGISWNDAVAQAKKGRSQ